MECHTYIGQMSDSIRITFRIPSTMAQDLEELMLKTPKYNTKSKFIRKMLKTMINNAKEKHII